MYRRLTFYILCYLLFIATKTSAYTFRFNKSYHINTPGYCSSMRVIDLRSNKETIGNMKTGPFNNTSPITTEEPLEKMLPEYFINIQKGNANEDEELLLVIYDIDIEEISNKKAVGTFLFDGDFYRGINGKYKFAGQVDSMYEVSTVSKKLADMVRSQINIFLTRYSGIPFDKEEYTLTETDIQQRRTQLKMQYPIYQTKTFRKGMYFTPEQFLNNEPDRRPVIKYVNTPYGNDPETYFYYADENGNKGERIKETDFFAYYDTCWYITSIPFSATMQYKNGDFFADLSFYGAAPRQTYGVGYSAIAGGIIGGAVGAVVVYGLTKAVVNEKQKTRSNKGWGLYEAKFDPEAKAFRPIARIK